MKILSRYIVRTFLRDLFFSVLSFTVVFVIIDMISFLNKYIDNGWETYYIALYYFYYLPYIFVLMLPIAMLITAILSIGKLNYNSELTAMRASGVSIYRTLLPVYCVSFFLSILIMIFTDQVVPRTDRMREFIKANRGKPPAGGQFRSSAYHERSRSHFVIQDRDGQNISVNFYDAVKREGKNISIKTIHTQSGVMLKRIDARRILWKDDHWILYDGKIREFKVNGEEIVTEFDEHSVESLTVKPRDFARVDMDPMKMNYSELSEYIKTSVEKGISSVESLYVELNLKIAFPFVSFIMVFFGAPLAAGSGQQSRTTGFGLGLLICFIYYIVIKLGQIYGASFPQYAFLAAWLPNFLFFGVGISLLSRVRK